MNLGVFLFIFFQFFAIALIDIFCVWVYRYTMVDHQDRWSFFFFQKYYVPFICSYFKHLCILVGPQLWITTIASGSIIWFIFAIACTFLVVVLHRAIMDTLSDILFTMLDNSQPYLEKETDVYLEIIMFRWLMFTTTFIIFSAWLAVAIVHGWVFFPKFATTLIVTIVIGIYTVCSWVYKWLHRDDQ